MGNPQLTPNQTHIPRALPPDPHPPISSSWALKNVHSNFCKMSCQTQSMFMFFCGLPFVLALVLVILLLLCLRRLPICEAAKNNDLSITRTCFSFSWAFQIRPLVYFP